MVRIYNPAVKASSFYAVNMLTLLILKLHYINLLPKYKIAVINNQIFWMQWVEEDEERSSCRYKGKQSPAGVA
jgi:hypothetical protein